MKLMVAINRASSSIAMRTRRGAGNKVIVSPTISKIVEKFPTFESYRDTRSSIVKKIGTIHATVDVYTYKYADDNEIIIGYKGTNTETDTGIVIAPYLMAFPSGVLLNPVTFEPVVAHMTRYSMFQDEKSKDYYCKLTLDIKNKPKTND